MNLCSKFCGKRFTDTEVIPDFSCLYLRMAYSSTATFLKGKLKGKYTLKSNFHQL